VLWAAFVCQMDGRQQGSDRTLVMTAPARPAICCGVGWGSYTIFTDAAMHDIGHRRDPNAHITRLAVASMSGSSFAVASL